MLKSLKPIETAGKYYTSTRKTSYQRGPEALRAHHTISYHHLYITWQNYTISLVDALIHAYTATSAVYVAHGITAYAMHVYTRHVTRVQLPIPNSIYNKPVYVLGMYSLLSQSEIRIGIHKSMLSLRHRYVYVRLDSNFYCFQININRLFSPVFSIYSDRK
jgi:hypothetical protein